MGMPKRDRNSRSSSSLSFFCWCVMFRALAAFAQAVALDGSRENDGWRALVFDRRLVGRVHFARVVTALPQRAQRLVGKVLDHFQEARIGAEDVLADIGAGFDD